jgi:hypothetical protein
MGLAVESSIKLFFQTPPREGNNIMNRSFFLVSTVIALCLGMTIQAQANAKKTLCIYDPGGASGDIFNMMKDFRLELVGHGVDFELKAYTDEPTVAADFKTSICTAALITGTRARDLHKFSGSIEAMGALPEYAQLKRVVRTLANPKVASIMKSGTYEVAGVFPAGAVYLFVRDRNVNTVGKLAGKKLATLSFDKAAQTMVRKVGASMIAADVSTFSGMFNNASVDACYAPAFAYKALELYKGLGSKGGVIRYPLAQMTMQLLVRSADFPPAFLQTSRELASKAFQKAQKTALQAESAIPAKHWIEIPAADKERYDEMFLDVRVDLKNAGVYHPKMLGLMRGVRCKTDATRAECTQKRE